VYSGRRYCLSLPLSSMSAFMGEHGVRCFEFPVADGRERRLRVRNRELTAWGNCRLTVAGDRTELPCT
jgi:hypothetical protein